MEFHGCVYPPNAGVEERRRSGATSGRIDLVGEGPAAGGVPGGLEPGPNGIRYVLPVAMETFSGDQYALDQSNSAGAVGFDQAGWRVADADTVSVSDGRLSLGWGQQHFGLLWRDLEEWRDGIFVSAAISATPHPEYEH